MILSLLLIMKSTSGESNCTCYNNLATDYPGAGALNIALHKPGYIIMYSDYPYPDYGHCPPIFYFPTRCDDTHPPHPDDDNSMHAIENRCCDFCCYGIGSKTTNKPGVIDGNPAITSPYNFATHSVNISVFTTMGLLLVLSLTK